MGTNANVVSAIAQVALFQGLTAAEQQRLAEIARPLAVPSHTNVMALEQPAETVYAIVQGTVRVQVEQDDGSLVILAFLGAGDVVGEMSLIESLVRSATVVALEPCQLLWMDRAALQSCVETMPHLALNLLRVLSRRLRLANERIQILATLDVSGRVARQIDALAGDYGEPVSGGGVRVRIRLTQADLADTVGASRERVNQVMVDLKRHRVISVDAAHHITVLDRAALARRYA